jgi:phosphatidylserine/phosphatidylglycerophosphate/cardiolipin synthase-like enzyme
MDSIIQHLQSSLEDTVLSKTEKVELKSLVAKQPLSDQELSFLRSKVYSLAMEKATADNFSFIIEWIKAATNALEPAPPESSGVFFSPGEECRNAILKRINGALHQINICVFTISDDRITNAIITAHKKGVGIKIITDNDKLWDEGSDIKQLAQMGIPIKMDATPNHMHHKFMVVDSKSLLTGSYNWTVSAMRHNHENILITDETGVVRSFLKEFDTLWRQMVVYK